MTKIPNQVLIRGQQVSPQLSLKYYKNFPTHVHPPNEVEGTHLSYPAHAKDISLTTPSSDTPIRGALIRPPELADLPSGDSNDLPVLKPSGL